VERSARERAVELFDRGVSFRGSGRYGEALDAWEKALALAPENRIYQANVQRLRSDLGRLRAHTPAIDVAGALRVQRPTLGPDAGVGLYRLLRLVAFDTMTGAEAVAAAHAAGEKIGRSLGVGKLDDLVALCASLKIGVVEAKVVTESSVRVVVRECVACAGAHHGHPGGTPTCHFEGGVFAGAVAPIFRRSVRVRETACIGGCGDDACRFEITFT
jgi:predicted hydrocarbon binding protein